MSRQREGRGTLNPPAHLPGSPARQHPLRPTPGSQGLRFRATRRRPPRLAMSQAPCEGSSPQSLRRGHRRMSPEPTPRAISIGRSRPQRWKRRRALNVRARPVARRRRRYPGTRRAWKDSASPGRCRQSGKWERRRAVRGSDQTAAMRRATLARRERPGAGRYRSGMPSPDRGRNESTRACTGSACLNPVRRALRTGPAGTPSSGRKPCPGRAGRPGHRPRSRHSHRRAD